MKRPDCSTCRAAKAGIRCLPSIAAHTLPGLTASRRPSSPGRSAIGSRFFPPNTKARLTPRRCLLFSSPKRLPGVVVLIDATNETMMSRIPSQLRLCLARINRLIQRQALGQRPQILRRRLERNRADRSGNLRHLADRCHHLVNWRRGTVRQIENLAGVTLFRGEPVALDDVVDVDHGPAIVPAANRLQRSPLVGCLKPAAGQAALFAVDAAR